MNYDFLNEFDKHNKPNKPNKPNQSTLDDFLTPPTISKSTGDNSIKSLMKELFNARPMTPNEIALYSKYWEDNN